ncbi:integrin-like repeat protein [Candidatus Vecturithrix granuli]|uniref:Integrin-like repeat protein n=1 Tax=Vecturithrix granuli TaxID=1499967 RepID=A0A081CA43_VECG1|nr:integrin-like repeat protein [Candidatus Vecturithrix granuli]
MKKRVIQSIFGLLSLVLFSGSVVLAENALIASATQLATKLHRYFPNVKGTVVSVQADNVFIDLGIEHDIVTGAQLAILQEGVEIVHPTTGKVLGSYEKLLGILQVTEARDKFSVAQVIWTDAGTEVAPGMMVGGIPGRVKVGMLPVKPAEDAEIDSLTVQRAVVQALQADERFTVFDEADLRAAAMKAGIAADQLIEKSSLLEINTILQAHNFLQVNVQPETGSDKILAQVALLSPQDEEIGSVQEMVDRGQAPLALNKPPAPPTPAVAEKTPVSSATVETPPPAVLPPSQPAVSPQRTQEKFWKSDILRMKAHKLAVGDLTGDGQNEVVITSQSEIEIYTHGVLGEKDSFRLIGKLEGFTSDSILNVDVADINQNGQAEIFLTTLQTISSDVQVFEYHDGRFREIWSTKGVVMRVLHRPGAEPLLIGQNTTSSLAFEFLSGKVAAYGWDGKNYTRQEALNIPGRMNIFGLALADVNADGVEESLWYDHDDRIQLFRNKALVWRSRSYEPYRMNVIRKGEEDDDDAVDRKARGRIELTKIKADNAMRLVLINNLRSFRVLQGLPMYNGSRFLIFRWNGEKFSEEFTSEEFDGYITDYVVTDIDQDEQQEIVLAMVLKGDNFFKTPQSQIVVYELE